MGLQDAVHVVVGGTAAEGVQGLDEGPGGIFCNGYFGEPSGWQFQPIGQGLLGGLSSILTDSNLN